jgi:protocatechuate 3,4-dioxygenase beta subunit
VREKRHPLKSNHIKKSWGILASAGLGLVVLAACSGRATPAERAVNPPTAVETGAVATMEMPASPSPVATGEPQEMAATEPAPAAPAAETTDCDGKLTLAQTEGPFYKPHSPERSSLLEDGMQGTPLLITGRVFNQDCEPIAGAMLDFWQTDDEGQYDNLGYRLRGHQFADEDGSYTLETVLPGEYPGRTAHIHVKVFAPDGRELLTTQIYIPGVSDQTPDGIFSPELLAHDLEPGTDGQRRLGFNFVVTN